MWGRNCQRLSPSCSVLPSAYGMLVISTVFNSLPNMTHGSSEAGGREGGREGWRGLGEGGAARITCLRVAGDTPQVLIQTNTLLVKNSSSIAFSAGGDSDKQTPLCLHSLRGEFWVTWFFTELWKGDAPKVMFIGVDFDVVWENTDGALWTYAYLLVGSRTCSQLCEASLQPGARSDGNCWWSHLQEQRKPLKKHTSHHIINWLFMQYADEARHTEPQPDQADTVSSSFCSVPAGVAIALNRSAGRAHPVCTRLTLAVESH